MYKYSIKIIIISILLISCFTIAAQDFHGMIIAGITGSQIDGDTQAGYNKMNGLFGLDVIYQITPAWGLQTGLEYQGKGAQKNINPNNNDYTYFITRLHYVEIPALINYTFRNKIVAEFGFSVGYLLSASQEKDGYPSPDDIMTRILPFDINAKAGINYVLTTHLGATFRWGYSVKPIALNPAWYNSLISISLFYKFAQKDNQ